MRIKKSPLFAESWNVAWREKGEGSILNDTVTPFNIIKNSFRYWAADPFLYNYNGRVYVFAELYDYIKCRGVLGYCEIKSGKATKWKPIIIENYHLSFPYIFQDDEDIYIMPESNSAEELYLYRAVSFPNKWKKVHCLRKEVQYADTTFICDGDHKYALTYEVSNPQNPSLWLLDLDNKKLDQKVNLAHIELRRPAGKVMQTQNIRCAQNCYGAYGKGLIFYKYSLKNNEYKEEEFLRLFPEDISLSFSLYLDGMHTYNFLDNYEVIDIKTRRFNILNLIFRFIRKIL